MNRNFFSYWHNEDTNNLSNVQEIKSFNLNFGPQHPASHGVLRLILQLRGEVIEKSDTHIGLLHRGTEKLIEDKNYLLSLPYFDRLDYVSVLAQEHSYCLAIENLLGTVNYQSNYVQVRVIFDELTRILNHLMAVSTHSLDVGCMAPVFWAFEEREKIMEFYERVSGARMHAAFYRPNDLSINYITSELLTDIIIFSKNLIKRLMMIENKLSMTSIWKYRLVNIGMIDYKFVNRWGLSGVLARSVGLMRDLRLSYNETYANYYYLIVRSFIGRNGDCYDRYLIRMREMVESLNIISQVTNNLSNVFYVNALDSNSNFFFPYLDYLSSYKLRSNKRFKQSTWYIGMEELINHFKYYSEGFIIPSGDAYVATEAPKGEFGAYVVSNNTNKPYRCKLRSPGFTHLQSLSVLAKGHMIADVVAIIGTLDLVFGEIDR